MSLDPSKMPRDQSQSQDQKDLDLDMKPPVCSHTDALKLFVTFEDVPHQQQDWSSSLGQEYFQQPPQIKEEQDELCISQEGEQHQILEEAPVTRFTFTPVPVKREEDVGEEPQSSQLHHTEQVMAHGDHCGRSAPAWSPDPCSHIKTELYPDTDDRKEEQSALSSTLDQEYLPELPHIKEEQEELWTSQEGRDGGPDPSKSSNEGSHIKTEPDPETNGENEQHRVWTNTLGKDYLPKPSHIKEEQEELWTSQDGGDGGPESSKSSYPGSRMKNESDPETDDKNGHQWVWTNGLEQDCLQQPPHLKEEQKELWTSQDIGDGGPQLAKSSDPGSHIKTEPSSDLESDDSWDWEDSRKLQPRSKPSEEDEVPVRRGRPIRCSLCGKRYPERNALTEHMRLHTEDRSFSCSFCGKRYPRRNALMDHMRLHIEGKRYSCSICHKTFQWREGLERHMRIHTGEKPFCCDFCGKTFTQRGGLRRHVIVHTGEKPFSCSVCSKSFGRPENLRRHLSLHEEEKQSEINIKKNKRTSLLLGTSVINEAVETMDGPLMDS